MPKKFIRNINRKNRVLTMVERDRITKKFCKEYNNSGKKSKGQLNNYKNAAFLHAYKNFF